MKKRLSVIAMLLCIAVQTSLAQHPKHPSSTEIFESLQKLNFLGSVLYIAAHPDDENTRLIAYMSNHVKARTAYLSLTRGDGGQNLIGPELRELLGVIRTQELLAARRVDGGEQRFSRANDFGYSKHPDETLQIWDKKAVLHDVVHAIRTFKPDVIINRFDHRTPGTTHGHHTSSALLSLEAFDLANNPNSYSNSAKLTGLWQPKRLFFNTSWWFYGSKSKFNDVDKSNLLSFDIGKYYPLKGKSNNEIAALASSQHLCQGFGRLSQRGTEKEYVEFLKGTPLEKDDSNLFSGIDTSWNRIKGGAAVGAILNKIEANFNFINPSAHIPDLVKAYRLLQNVEDLHWKQLKSKALLNIIEMCAGLYLEASATENWATQGEQVELSLEALNRSNTSILLQNIIIDTVTITKNIDLKFNTKYTFAETFKIPEKALPTTPYWLTEKSTLGMYKVNDANLIGKPETPRYYNVSFQLLIDKTPITLTKPIIQRLAKPDKGEVYRPFEIVPEASVKLKDKVLIFKDDTARNIQVTVSAHKANIKGVLKIESPEGWTLSPKTQTIAIKSKGDTQNFTFKVTPPKTQSEGVLRPVVELNGKRFSKTLTAIDYDHIPLQTVVLPSESKIVRLDIKKKGENIGYIQGAGDVVPESLAQIGYNVQLITPNEINPETLSKFDAVVIGIRAYNVLETLQFKQDILFDFVKNGGNMLVQYNTSHRLKTKVLAPYKLQLSRDRVTNENAEVRFLAPKHEVLNTPNTITQKDFEGWTQERGLYFPNQWDKAFTAILAMNDQGETSKKGSLLVAKYGKGHYIYTGLSFFREFPAGVPGAYRLFANLLSLGKTE